MVPILIQVFLPSPRNPPAVTADLLQQTSSSKLFHTAEVTKLAETVCALQTDLQAVLVGTLDEFLQKGPEFPFDSSFEDKAREPMLTLHSSGSTGLPKLVTFPHGSYACTDRDFLLLVVPGRKNQDLTIFDFEGKGGKFYTIFPQFHTAGFFVNVVVPLYSHAVVVTGPTLLPPSGALLLEIMQQQKLLGIYVPPLIVEHFFKEPGGFYHLRSLDWVCFTGGPLSQPVGDALSKETLLCQYYGSRETEQIHQLVPKREDWSWMEWHPSERLEMREVDNDLFEVVLFPPQHGEDPTMLSCNFPEVSEWHTQDLFKQHPSKPQLWRFYGRRDDLILLSNGVKLNPIPLESAVLSYPAVAGALMIGQGRFQPALLIEPSPDCERECLVQSLWPLVQKANAAMPGHGRIVKSMILLSTLTKPFTRAAKGTIVRELTERDYGEEIEALYTQRSLDREMPVSKSMNEESKLQDLVRRAVLPAFPDSTIGDDDDLLGAGLDSLKALEIATDLKQGLDDLSSNPSLLTPKFVYQHSSIT